MLDQPILTYDEFAARANNEKWSRDRALHAAFDWYVQADLPKRALQQLMHANVTLVVMNDHLIDLLQRLNAVDLIDPAVLEQYKSLRMNEMCEGEFLIKQGMELNANLAATTAVSEKQRHAASGPRSRSPNSAQNRVTDAMHIWRRSNSSGSLRDFLAAVAGAEDDYEFRISELANGKYEVDCEGGDEADDGKEISWSGLEKWWGKSAKERHCEPPRVRWRLQLLREWSHEQVHEVFP
jgi:hypothetical protein